MFRESISKSVLAVAVVLTTSTPSEAFRGPRQGTIEFRYTEAKSDRHVKNQVAVTVPTITADKQEKTVTTDPRILKTIFLANLGNAIQTALKGHDDVCKTDVSPTPIPVPRPIMPPRHPLPPVDDVSSECKAKFEKISEALFNDILKMDQDLNQNPELLADQKVIEMLDLTRKLAQNIRNSKGRHFSVGLERGGNIKTLSTPAGAGLNLTGGGAQDIEFFRKTVMEGFVPSLETFIVEGFLSEFDLSLTAQKCGELVCVQPAVAVNQKLGKMFVQVGMNSNVTKESFMRNALNVSIVLDVSGSMSATDGTEKSRLEWAKDAVRHTIQQLNAYDTVSIVLFDTDMDVLVEPTIVRNHEVRQEILDKVAALKTKGSTNLEAGLRQGYEFVSKNYTRQMENRVILISDAGVNTGVTKDEDLLKLVSDFAGEDIGLTAIGLGLNFKQDLINSITKSKGGNYVYVHSGKKMYAFFESFNYLVTPVVHNFKVELDLGDIPAKLVKAYGIPTEEGKEVRELMNIRSLFFSEQGGALLLEYDLN